MGDKFSNKNKHGKKQTTKEKKAANHLKLMEGSKERHANTNVTPINGQNNNKDKKAA